MGTQNLIDFRFSGLRSERGGSVRSRENPLRRAPIGVFLYVVAWKIGVNSAASAFSSSTSAAVIGVKSWAMSSAIR